ncbi:hypothetical protein LY78DRAFT_679283 [Colletotrichum sublineola]|nr:hypothetical protein LY78DRAFT_679283 [Colletotrichum sublineola]
MLSWDGIHNTKNSHQVPANRMDEPVGYAEHQAAMEAERIRAEQRAAEQRESDAEHQAEAEARENSAERGEAELRDDDVEMMDGTDWRAAQPRQQSPQASGDMLSGPDFEAAQARFQRLRPDDDNIYDATPRLSTPTLDRSVEPESPHHDRHQEDGDEDMEMSSPPFAMIPRRAGSLPPVLVTQGQLSLEDAIRELTTGPVTSARRVNKERGGSEVFGSDLSAQKQKQRGEDN